MLVGKVRNLVKVYRRKIPRKGLLGAIKDLFNPIYEDVEALKGISFDIKKGEIIGYIGPNGAGKTTTIKILSGILYPTSGEVEILGYIPWEQRKEYVRNIGVLFSGITPLWWYLPVEDTFLLHKDIYKIDDKEYKERIELFDELLSIKEILNKPVRQLSAGQRRRAEIALVFLHKPKIVFLDEPTVYLDVIAKDRILNFIKEIVRREKVSVILTTHIMGDVERICDRIIIIDKGVKVFEGTLEELQRYIKYKIVEIKLRERIELRKFVEEYKIIEEKENKIKMMVPIELVKETIAELLKLGEIEDINVYSPSLEDIIKKIYEEGL